MLKWIYFVYILYYGRGNNVFFIDIVLKNEENLENGRVKLKKKEIECLNFSFIRNL